MLDVSEADNILALKEGIWKYFSNEVLKSILKYHLCIQSSADRLNSAKPGSCSIAVFPEVISDILSRVMISEATIYYCIPFGLFTIVQVFLTVHLSFYRF